MSDSSSERSALPSRSAAPLPVQLITLVSFLNNFRTSGVCVCVCVCVCVSVQLGKHCLWTLLEMCVLYVKINVHAMQAQTGSRGIALLIPNFGTR